MPKGSNLPTATSPDAIDLVGVQAGVTRKLPSTLLATQAELDAHLHTGTYVGLTGAETVAGVKTFASGPVVPLLSLPVIDPSGARYNFQQSTGTFESGFYSDTQMFYGYNVSTVTGVKALSAEPMLFVQMESKFRQNAAAAYGSEYHLNFQRPNIGGGCRRPINIFMEHVNDWVDLSLSADTFSVSNAAGFQTLNYGSGVWFFHKPVALQGGASAPTVLSIGDALNDATLVFNAKSVGFVNAIKFQRTSADKWWLYDAGNNDLYFRDMQNGRMQITLIAGASDNAAYTDFGSNIRAYGSDNQLGPNANNLTIGSLGTTAGWIDARGSNANIDINLRAKGTGVVASLSPHRFDGNVGFYATAPIAKRGTTADATDLASVITLANALKADLVAYGLKS